jgi:hypothetical protein
MISITEQRKLAVWFAIQPHTANNPITMEDIIKSTKIKTKITAIVKILRCEGKPIVGNKKGFYLAKSSCEFDPILKVLYRQKATAEKAIEEIIKAKSKF